MVQLRLVPFFNANFMSKGKKQFYLKKKKILKPDHLMIYLRKGLGKPGTHRQFTLKCAPKARGLGVTAGWGRGETGE